MQSLFVKGGRMAFVWAAFLVAGPGESDLRWFFDKIVSLTTDYGVEVGGEPIPPPHPKSKIGTVAYVGRVASWSRPIPISDASFEF